MLRVGLTGGYASGKSSIARHMEEFGCHVIRADDLGHHALAPDGEAYSSVLEAFGSGILKNDGTIDRRALGAIVFADPDKLAVLNQLVHPHIFARQDRLIAGMEAADPHGIAVIEAAIMIETGSHIRYDKLIVAFCPEGEQIRRAVARDGITEAQAMDRIRRQMPIEEKLKMADFVIDTTGTPEQTKARAREVFLTLQRMQRQFQETAR